MHSILHKPLLILALALLPAFSLSQSKEYQAAKSELYKTLKSRYIGPRFSESIDRFYNRTSDSLVKKMRTFQNMPMDAVLARLFSSCSQELKRRSITRPRITMINDLLMETIRKHPSQSVRSLYRNSGIIPCKILGYAFQGSSLGDSIQDLAAVREMIRYPYMIGNRILQPRFDRFHDTLLYFMANRAPMEFLNKISAHDPGFGNLVNQSRNRTVKAIASLAPDVNINRILPFALAISENRITLDQVKSLAMNPTDYYREFTAEISYLKQNPEPETRNFLRLPLVDLNAQFAREFYINEINELHEKSDQIRFKIIENLSDRELYYLILGGEDELYTSSFLHIFHQFLQKTESSGLDNFFEKVAYNDFDRFLSILTVYGMEHELITRMKDDSYTGAMKKILNTLTGPLLTDEDLVYTSMYLAEIFQKTKDLKGPGNILSQHLDSLQKKSAADNLLTRIFGAFKDILTGTQVVMNEEKETMYDKLAVRNLVVNNLVTEVSLFYDDDDGVSSFNTFCATFDPHTWLKEDKGNFLVFTSKKGVNKIIAYANKPNTRAGSDTAQKEMMDAIQQEGHQVSLFIHRGHSYHLLNSLSMLSPSAELVYLGSCGGYHNVMNAFSQNHSSQFIATRKIGSKLINDPLLKRIHQDILENRDINWKEYWTFFNQYFQNSHTKDLFSGYNPPYKFYGIMFVRSVFNY